MSSLNSSHAFIEPRLIKELLTYINPAARPVKRALTIVQTRTGGYYLKLHHPIRAYRARGTSSDARSRN
jgi:hypothetical protein